MTPDKTIAKHAGEVPELLDQHLREVLASVNEWLRFAEGKNTTALTRGSAALGVLVQFIVSHDGPWRSGTVAGLMLSAALLVLSLFVSLLSFLPQTTVEQPSRARQSRVEDNLLFYGHLARHDPEALVRAMSTRYFEPTSGASGAYASDVAFQVVANSRITVRKLNLFRWAMTLFVLGTVIGALSVALGRSGW
jgi:hypothetical protein